MAGIPTGAGTEVLKRTIVEANNDAWVNVITGIANHIYTVLSIVATNQEAATRTIYIRLGTAYMLNHQLGNVETFVWNDKFVVSGAEDLQIYNSAGNVDWFCSYIDQDMTYP